MTAERAIEFGDELVETIDRFDDDVREKAEDFFASVRRGVLGVLATVKRTGQVTAAQERSLRNWDRGVAAWVRD